jgi:hypothetical protein
VGKGQLSADITNGTLFSQDIAVSLCGRKKPSFSSQYFSEYVSNSRARYSAVHVNNLNYLESFLTTFKFRTLDKRGDQSWRHVD